jgi:hypothetical protein
VDCFLIAGDGRDEQRALCWKATRNVQQLKLASLVHGGGQQELESLLDFGRLGVEVSGLFLRVIDSILDINGLELDTFRGDQTSDPAPQQTLPNTYPYSWVPHIGSFGLILGF